MNRVVLCLVVLSAACHAPRIPPVEAAPDPRILSGRWRLELSARYLVPFGPAVLGGPTDPYLLGDLQLDSTVTPIDRGASSAPGIRGTFVTLLSYGEEPPRVEIPAMATFRPDGQAVVTVSGPGPCPCRVIELVGALEDGEIRGRATVAYRDFTTGRRFVLRRRFAP